MRLSTRPVGARLRALFRSDASSVRQGFAALLIASLGNLLAGLTLGKIQHTLEALPGLLVLVPAAIGMRGNIFGALGSRLGTTIHTGTFRLSRRPDSVVGQNLLAAMALSLPVSVALAVLAKAIAVGFGLANTISITDFVIISVVGGILSSIVVLGITVGVAAGSVRFGWDLDTVAAPVITAAGDVVTLPALFLATYLIGIDVVSPVLALTTTVLSIAALVGAVRAGLPLLRRIVRESLPVLLVAGAIDVVAGLTIEKRLEHFLTLPALLVLVPPFLEDAGALGGILASRVSSKLHLGLIEPTAFPSRVARGEFLLVAMFGAPMFAVVGVSSHVAATIVGLPGPGLVAMVQVSMLAGAMALVFALAIAYYGAIAAYRLGLDPDNHGIPMVTSSMDLVGAFAVVLAIVMIGLG